MIREFQFSPPLQIPPGERTSFDESIGLTGTPFTFSGHWQAALDGWYNLATAAAELARQLDAAGKEYSRMLRRVARSSNPAEARWARKELWYRRYRRRYVRRMR